MYNAILRVIIKHQRCGCTVYAVDPWRHAGCSRSDQQIHGMCRQAADYSNRAMEAQTAIQQLYKLLYTSCIEAKIEAPMLQVPRWNCMHTAHRTYFDSSVMLPPY